MRHALRETNALSDIVMIVLAILLPPLAVFLHEGLGSRFWISILLTLLFFIPGVIFALLVVTDSI
ncbi:YqaE/Pmp3 family membrane protein [Rufibacter glacialis]|uniref:YqaE/Pmp3 family membrane protein n=1 Tax=Rufibacter glacialis TaxID=1259555 RepID=A0A5M8QCH5_9BACT|nr:YqaE/Pmp3 family membrane protein [Rufibacter glacialis]